MVAMFSLSYIKSKVEVDSGSAKSSALRAKAISSMQIEPTSQVSSAQLWSKYRVVQKTDTHFLGG